ncbi:response regulator transcription factor [Tissierella praeacuta]|uniref:response regulator transcription factor n=1 Tax=Tissierella praeacuta TaxID=43131 RepID=UPI00333EED24
MTKILIVEDDKSINDLIAMNLSIIGYNCEKAFSGDAAAEMIKRDKFDLILLDIMLPGVSGIDLLKLNICEDTKVILITAKGGLNDKLEAFNLGAYDYIVKPFEMLELIARVKVALKDGNDKDNIKIKDVEIKLREHKVLKAGDEVDLTILEYNLLDTLVMNKNVALSREKLLELVWGYDFIGDSRTVDVHIMKLRKKLDFDDVIKTVYKMGYRLEVSK